MLASWRQVSTVRWNRSSTGVLFWMARLLTVREEVSLLEGCLAACSKDYHVRSKRKAASGGSEEKKMY